MKVIDDIKTPVAILVCIAVLLAASTYVGDEIVYQIPKTGLKRAEVHLEGQDVYLTSECRGIAMVVSESQALSIYRALTGRIGRRPGTHDLLRDVLRGYEINTSGVVVHSMRNGTYYADLYLRKKGRVLKLDVRPSDGIATALRTRAPVYVKKDLLEKYGRDFC